MTHSNKTKEELIKEIELLRISEEKFRFISEHSPDVVFNLDENAIINYISPSVTNTFGYDPDDLINHPIFDFISEGDAQRVFTIFKEDIKRGEPTKEFCFLGKHKNGNERIVELTASKIVKKGSSAKIIGIIRDVTNRKGLEEFEKKNTSFLQTIIDSIAHPFYAIDINNYTIIFANRHTEKFIPGKTTCYQLTHNRDTPCNCKAHPCAVDMVKKTGKSTVLEHVHYDKNGKMRHVEVHAHPIIEEDGQIKSIIEYSVDISERKLAEEHLLRLEKAIYHSGEAIFLTDVDGVITYINPAFTATYGYTSAEVVGKCKPNILKSGMLDQAAYKNFWNALLNKIEVKGEITNRRKDGSFVEIGSTSNAIIDEYENIIGFLSIQRDITEQKNNDSIIQEHNRQLLEFNATKDKFFSIIAHDLKSPFNSIIGLSELLVKNSEKYDHEKIQKYSRTISQSANETFKLLENLLEWARIQQAGIKPNIQAHNLKIIVLEVCLLYSDVAENKNIILQNNIQSDFEVSCDKDMTKTILRNLISNAIKFTGSNGTVSINTYLQNSQLVVQVNDTGTGIPPENIPQLFTLGKKNTIRGTAGENGSGLGLVLCKELVENQGGEIWVKSDPERGSSFNFSIPYKTIEI